MIDQAFLRITCHFIFPISCGHASCNTSSEMLNVKFISKKVKEYGRPMRGLSVMENIQEKLEHNVREMEEQLAKLTSLFEDMSVHPRGSSPLPHQQVPQPSVQTTSYPPRETDRPNLRQPRPTAPPAFVQHLDMPISQVVQGANLANERLTRTSSDGTPSPSPTLSCSQS